MLALGIPGTAIAYLLFFGLIAGAGAAYASLVTYLIPPIALAYGAIFLGERFGVTAFGGLALILGGVALGTGVFTPSRLRPSPGVTDVTGIELRRARADDADFLLELITDEDTRPFLGGRAGETRDDVVAEIERSEREPDAFGWFVIEVDGERAGCVAFHRDERAPPHRRGRPLRDPPELSRPAASAPRRRGCSSAICSSTSTSTGSSCRSTASTSARSRTPSSCGYVREGVKRKAYLKHGEWQDAVLFSLLQEELPDE